MQVQSVLICLIFHFLQINFVTAVTATIGRYKLSGRSSKLTQCVSELMSEKELSGVRVNESTEKCEGMSGPWDEDNVQPGYQYAKLMHTKESFWPSKSAKHRRESNLYFPIVFNPGTTYSLNVTWPQMTWDIISFSLYKKATDNRRHFLYMSISDRGKYITTENIPDDSVERQVFYNDTIFPGSKCKISFVSSGNRSIKIMFNGVSMATWEAKSSCFNLNGILTIFYRELSFKSFDSFQIHGTEYILGANGSTNCS